MSTVIGKLNATLSADTMGFDVALTRSTKKLKGFEQTAHIVGSGIASVGQKFFLGAAGTVAAGVAVLGQRTHKAYGDMDNLSKMADRLGDTTENLSGLAYAANLADVDIESLNKAMERQSLVLGKALNGNKAAIDLFETLGLDAAKLAKERPTDVLLQIGAALEKLPTQAQRMDAIKTVFGKSGNGLINLLNSGTAEIRKMMAENENLINSFTRLDGKKIEAVNDAFTTVSTAMDGLGKKAAIELSPTMIAVANSLTTAFTWAGNKMKGSGQWLLDKWIDVSFFFKDFFKLLAAGFASIIAKSLEIKRMVLIPFKNAGSYWGEFLKTGSFSSAANQAANDEQKNMLPDQQELNWKEAAKSLQDEINRDYDKYRKDTLDLVNNALKLPPITMPLYDPNANIGIRDKEKAGKTSDRNFAGAYERGSKEAYSIEIGSKNALDKIAKSSAETQKEIKKLNNRLDRTLDVNVDGLQLMGA